jgi:hypothetical protein
METNKPNQNNPSQETVNLLIEQSILQSQTHSNEPVGNLSQSESRSQTNAKNELAQEGVQILNAKEVADWRSANKIGNVEAFPLGHFSLSPESPLQVGQESKNIPGHFLIGNDSFYVLLFNGRNLHVGKFGSTIHEVFNINKLLNPKGTSSISIKNISITNHAEHNILVLVSNADMAFFYIQDRGDKIVLMKIPMKISLKCSIHKIVWIGYQGYLNADNQIQMISFSSVDKFADFESQEDFSNHFKYDEVFSFPAHIHDFDVSAANKLFYILSGDTIFVYDSLGVRLHSFTPSLNSGEKIKCIKGFRQSPPTASPLTLKDEKEFAVKDMILSLTNKNKLLIHDVSLLKYDDEEKFRISKYDLEIALRLPQTILSHPEIFVSKHNDKIFIHHRQLHALFVLHVNEYYQKPRDDIEDNKDIIPFVEKLTPLILPENTSEIAIAFIDKKDYLANHAKAIQEINNATFNSILAINCIGQNEVMRSFNVPDLLFKVVEQTFNQSLLQTNDDSKNQIQVSKNANAVEKKSKAKANKRNSEDVVGENKTKHTTDHSESKMMRLEDLERIALNDNSLAKDQGNAVEMDADEQEKPAEPKIYQDLKSKIQSQRQRKASGLIKEQDDSKDLFTKLTQNALVKESLLSDNSQKVTGFMDVRMIEEMMYNNQMAQQANQKEGIELPELNKLGQGSGINDSQIIPTPQFGSSEVNKPFSFMDQSSNMEKEDVSAQNDDVLKNLLIMQNSNANMLQNESQSTRKTAKESNQTESKKQEKAKSIPKNNSSTRKSTEIKKADANEMAESQAQSDNKTKAVPENNDQFKKSLNDILTSFHDRLYSKISRQLRDLKVVINREALGAVSSAFKAQKKTQGEEVCRQVDKNVVNTFQKYPQKANDIFANQLGFIANKINERIDAKMASVTQTMANYNGQLKESIKTSESLNEILNQVLDKSSKPNPSDQNQETASRGMLKDILESLTSIQEDQNTSMASIHQLTSKIQMLEFQCGMDRPFHNLNYPSVFQHNYPRMPEYHEKYHHLQFNYPESDLPANMLRQANSETIESSHGLFSHGQYPVMLSHSNSRIPDQKLLHEAEKSGAFTNHQSPNRNNEFSLQANSGHDKPEEFQTPGFFMKDNHFSVGTGAQSDREESHGDAAILMMGATRPNDRL